MPDSGTMSPGLNTLLATKPPHEFEFGQRSENICTMLAAMAGLLLSTALKSQITNRKSQMQCSSRVGLGGQPQVLQNDLPLLIRWILKFDSIFESNPVPDAGRQTDRLL
jgi:hypothetical protein